MQYFADCFYRWLVRKKRFLATGLGVGASATMSFALRSGLDKKYNESIESQVFPSCTFVPLVVNAFAKLTHDTMRSRKVATRP